MLKIFIRLITVFTLILLIAASCDVNTPEDVVLLRTDRFSRNTADHVEKWVVISNQRGRVLDYRETTDAQGLLEFNGAGGDQIIVTEIRVSSFENGDQTLLHHVITSYIGVPVGSTYTVDESGGYGGTPYPDPVGTAKFTLLNYSGSDDPFYSVGLSDGYFGLNTFDNYEEWTYDGSMFSGEFDLREDTLDILFSSYQGTTPVYRWARDVSVGDSVVLDFNEFQPMLQLSVNKPVQGYVRGLPEPSLAGRNYDLSRTDYWRFSNDYDPALAPVLGYLEGFEFYDIYLLDGEVLCCQPHERTTYHRLSTDVPESVNLPDYSLNIQNQNLFDLQYTFNGRYTVKSLFASVEEENRTLWFTINAPEDAGIVVPRIPNEIISRYPYLNRNSLPLKTVRFTEHQDGFSYTDFLRHRFELQSPRKEFEELSYFKQF